MTHTLTKAITALTLAVASFLPANAQDAFFVYRNDGQFNAFFNDEIDSIVCSNIDLDSIVHEEFVVQEFHTPDSIYRIPIASIDSVGFQKPEITLHKNVIRMEDGLCDCLVKRTGMTLYFESPIANKRKQLTEGNILLNFIKGQEFAGKITEQKDSANYIIVECDTIRHINEIFDRLIGIEAIGNSNVTRSYKEDKIPPINITASISTGEIKLGNNVYYEATGSFNGEVCGKVFYNKDVDCYHVFIDHNWYPTFDLSVNIEANYEKYFKSIYNKSIFFPTTFPIFEFNFDVRYFIKANINANLTANFTGNKASYLTSFTYRENSIGDKNNRIKNEEKSHQPPHISCKSSISGEIHTGISFRSYLGFNSLLALGIKTGGFSEICIGPEFKGELELLDLGASTKEDLYNTLKEGYLSISPLSAKADFYVGILPSDPNEDPIIKSDVLSAPNIKITPWKRYFFPDFSNIEIVKNIAEKSANFKSTPNRDLVFPLSLGIGLFDSDGNMLDSKYSEQTYWNEKDGIYLNETFTNLLRNKNYQVHPIVKFLEQDIAAFPSEEFKIECEARTGGVDNIELNSAICMGEIDMPDEYNILSYGICYSSSTQNPEITNSQFKNGTNENFSIKLTGLDSDTQYFYRAYLAIDGEYTYGDVISFKTKKEMDEEVDLGLSVNWRGWNVGATKPEEYGNYFAWGETSQKEYYAWQSYFENPYDDNDEWIGSATTTDIAGTDKDAATVILGEKWRMPTYEEVKELMEKCSWTWSDYNGVKGYTVESNVAGYEGNFIFLPAAGNYDKTSIKQEGSYGGYWSSTPLDSESKSAAYIFYFYGETIHSTQSSNRYTGRTIRPITPKEDQ